MPKAHKPLAVVDDPLFSEHRAEDPHPERPERLEAARAAVARADLTIAKTPLGGRDASDEELARVHAPAYIAELERSRGRSGYLDPDTYYGPRSVAAARRAAGSAVALIEALSGGAAAYGLALLRPPGHHARSHTAMGFCLINNVAVAAAAARAGGAERVAIVDWDVHHGNGTQEMFYDDPHVLYVSLHQFPFYPGTGAPEETGRAEGRGYTVNVALSAGADDAAYAASFERIVAPVISQFDPDLVLVSAGFDAHRRDPLAAMTVTDDGYAAMAHALAHAIPGGADGRIGLFLEGGYDLEGLRGALRATLEAIAGERRVDPISTVLSPRHEADLERAERALRPYWKFD